MKVKEVILVIIKSITKHSLLSAVKDLTNESFRIVEPEQCRKNINHVRDKVEDPYWITDNLYTNVVYNLCWRRMMRKKAAMCIMIHVYLFI